jgi:hypothetical protein
MFPFPPLWMRAEDGTRVDVSGIYYFVIFAILLVTLPLWLTWIRSVVQ